MSNRGMPDRWYNRNGEVSHKEALLGLQRHLEYAYPMYNEFFINDSLH